jgi:hypothetical protein
MTGLSCYYGNCSRCDQLNVLRKEFIPDFMFFTWFIISIFFEVEILVLKTEDWSIILHQSL